jgi:hypothetical protein
MIMKRKLITIAFLIGSCIAASLAFGQDHNILLEGTVFSKSATIPPGTSSAVLFDIPGKRKLIVTQFCRNLVFLELSGSKLGRVPAEMGVTCQTYVPGVLFKWGQSVICEATFSNAEFDGVCLINGVLQ